MIAYPKKNPAPSGLGNGEGWGCEPFRNGAKRGLIDQPNFASGPSAEELAEMARPGSTRKKKHVQRLLDLLDSLEVEGSEA